MAYPQLPGGYQIPKQAYVKGDGNLYVPAKLGPLTSFLNAGVSFPNFGALMPGCLGYYRSDVNSKTGSVINRMPNLLPLNVTDRWTDIVEGAAGVGIGGATAGLKGVPGVLANGTTQYGTYTATNIGATLPAASNVNYFAVMRNTVLPTAQSFFTGNSGFALSTLQLANVLTFEAYDGSGLDTALITNSWGVTYQSFTGAADAVNKWGSTSAVIGDAGNAAGAPARGFLATQSGTAPSRFETVLFLAGRAPKATFLAAVPALIAAVKSAYLGTVPILS